MVGSGKNSDRNILIKQKIHKNFHVKKTITILKENVFL